METLKALYDYRTPIEAVIDYSGDSGYTSSNYDVYASISDIDQDLKKYLKNVLTIIEEERSNYGLNKASFTVAGVDIANVPVKEIIDSAQNLTTRWKKIKTKIEKATLKERVNQLSKIISSCRFKIAPGAWLLYPIGMASDEDTKLITKVKEFEGYLDYTQERLNKMD